MEIVNHPITEINLNYSKVTSSYNCMGITLNPCVFFLSHPPSYWLHLFTVIAFLQVVLKQNISFIRIQICK